MPIYKYVAINRKSKEEKGIVDAPNPATARKVLKTKGLYLKTIQEDREKRERQLFPFLAKFIYRVPRRDVGLFVRQLGTLIGAGLPLDRSLANIIDQTENESLAKALIDVRAKVIEGDKLSDALAKHPAIFPNLYTNLVSIGEKTGQYEESLLRLADLEEANQILKGKVTAALFYPVVMLVLLGLIMIFLLAVVVPQIQNLFVQLDAELPLITKIVIGISNFLTNFPLNILPILMVAGGVYMYRRYTADPAGKRRVEQIILRIPVIGHLIRKVVLARFSRNLAVMLQSRVPLIMALQVVTKVVENETFADEIQKSIVNLQEGMKLTESLRESQLVSQMMLGMLSAGESSDQVPQMMGKIADVLDGDVNATLQRFSALLEPIMIVLMGFLIIMIMSAILLPMYNLTEQIQF